jgi:hypothetical protein
MKRRSYIEIAAWLCAFVCFMAWTTLRADEINRKTKNPYSAGTGQLTTSNSATWNLADIEADTDSCVFSTVFDMTNADLAPKAVVVYVVWTAAAGGSTTTSFGVTLFAHGANTSTAGSNTTQFDNRVPLGAWQVAPNDTASVACKATAAGEAVMFIVESASPYSAPSVLPRYVSVAIQKEGNGKFTAGTVTVYIYPDEG